MNCDDHRPPQFLNVNKIFNSTIYYVCRLHRTRQIEPQRRQTPSYDTNLIWFLYWTTLTLFKYYLKVNILRSVITKEYTDCTYTMVESVDLLKNWGYNEDHEQ